MSNDSDKDCIFSRDQFEENLFEAIRDLSEKLAKIPRVGPFDSGEVTQKTTLKLLKFFRRGKARSNIKDFSAFIGRCVRHGIIDSQRAQRRRERHEIFLSDISLEEKELGIAYTGTIDHDAPHREEIHYYIRHLVERIPQPLHREAVRLRYLHGLPYEEVANRLGISKVNARACVSRGCEVLRRLILQFNEPRSAFISYTLSGLPPEHIVPKQH